MTRVGKMLVELAPQIQAQRIMRRQQVFDAPPEAWLWAIDQAIIARDEGRLRTPLKDHNWLYEVISSWRPVPGQIVTDTTTSTALVNTGKQSKTLAGIAALEVLKNGG